MDTLLSTVKSFQKSAQRDYKDGCYVQRKERNQSFKSIIASFDENIFGLLRHIRKVTQNNESNDADKVTHISHLLDAHNESIPQAEQPWDSLKQDIANEAGESRYDDILEERSIRLQNRVSPIIKALSFQGDAEVSALLDTMMYFKDKDGVIGKKVPLEFLEPQERDAVTKDDVFSPLAVQNVLLQ